MKKFLAMILVVMMVVAMTSAAMAANSGSKTSSAFEANEGVGGLATAKPTLTITKGYGINGADDTTNKHPADTLTFTVSEWHYYYNGVENTYSSTNTTGVVVPNIPNTNITTSTVTESTDKATISITLPEYTKVGEYVYYLVETDANTAGVTYNYLAANPLVLKVTIIRDTDTTSDNYNKLIIGGYALRDGGDDGVHSQESDYNKEKLDNTTGSVVDVHNNYEYGKLTINKTVTGNMGDTTKPWLFKVKLTPPSGDTVRGTVAVTGAGTYVYYGTNSDTTANTSTGVITAGTVDETGKIDPPWNLPKELYFTLTSGASISFDNLPKGTTYEITEVEAGMYGYSTTASGADTIVTASTEDKNAQATAAQLTGGITAASQTDTANYVNDNTVTIDTGISLDTVPYIMILALAFAGFVVLMSKKRREQN